MSKILLFSDLHVHMHKQSLNRLDDCLKALKWVFDTALAKGINTIVFAGDLFQDRHKIHIISYEKTFHIINDYCSNNPNLKLFILVGNHDMWFSDRWDVSSVSPLQVIRNVKVINKPEAVAVTDDCVIDFLPYTKNPIEDINTHFIKKNDILVSHVSINGAQLNSLHGTKAEISVEFEGDMVKVDADAFNGWKRVFLGHYHCSQKLNEYVEYIGSPLELNFGEAFQQKHIIIFDTQTFTTEYVINDFSPKHLIIKEDEVDKFDLEGNFVQVIVNDIGATDIMDLKKSASNKKCATLEFKEKTKVKKEEDKTCIKLDFSGEILQEWLKFKGCNNLDENKLLKIGEEIIRSS